VIVLRVIWANSDACISANDGNNASVFLEWSSSYSRSHQTKEEFLSITTLYHTGNPSSKAMIYIFKTIPN
jgi:hypothetical protein